MARISKHVYSRSLIAGNFRSTLKGFDNPELW